ncbi:hypothetical protein FB45DRAFT_1027816 [Roridomyces roridus]|uniref:Uncharacterized protein n=1 Tax=Roridomyces roridus TaxID=1738132 RepID=A0AAD7BU08_9AGAR|nr:hypothetical protein FB45DRAFT_1027816 [Roridomyces roridus]
MDDDYENLPDPFANVDVNWEQLLAPSPPIPHKRKAPVTPDSRKKRKKIELEDELTCPICFDLLYVHTPPLLVAFTPALGQTCHVSANGASAELHFTAILDEDIGPAKLQLWSDIPANGRRPGDWGEADFQPISLSNEPAFPLHSVGEQEQFIRTLTLVLSVPIISATQRFSFTYRLVSENDTEWLGAYGHNGILVLSRTDTQSPVVLGQGWKSVGSHSHRMELPASPVRDFEVARISHHEDYFAIENSFLHSKNSATLVLVPRLFPRPVVLPPVLIFGSASGSLSFSSHGTIMATGAGCLFFTACDRAAGAPAIFRDFSPCRVRLVGTNCGALALASPAEKHPVQVLVIPITSSNPLTHSSLTVRSLSSLVPSGAPFCVFSSVRRHARVFPGPEASGDTTITFAVGESGGHLVVAPIEKLDNPAEEGQQLAIVTPYTPLPIAADRLPTPPPSPRLRPLIHRTAEFESPDPSFLSLPAAISHDDRAGSPSQLVVNGASQRRAGLLAGVRHFFIMFFIWIVRFFRRRPKMITATADADERTPLLREPVTPRQESASPSLVEADQPFTSRTSVHIGAGKTTIVSFKSASAVPIHLDGKEVEPDVQDIGDGLLLVEFTTAAGGRLRIGW